MAGKAAWAITDQALFSASNWLLQILLTNCLPNKTEWGSFALAFTWFLLVGAFHTAFLVEPMLVFGADRYARRRPKYLGALVIGNLMLGIVGALALVLGGWMYWHSHIEDSQRVAVSMWSLAAASPCIFFLWLMRRASYLRGDPREAAFAGMAYLVLMVSMLLGLYGIGKLSVPTAMGVMGASCLIAGGWLMWREGVRVPRRGEGVLGEVWHDHWRYGRWAAASGLVLFIPGQIYYPLLTWFNPAGGLEEAGALRAISNLFLPFIQANSALCVLLLPILVKAIGTETFGRTLRWALLVLAGVPALFWLVSGLFGSQIMRLVYPRQFDAYHEYAPLLWIFGTAPVLIGLYGAFHAVLAAHQRPDRVFAASLLSAVMSLTVGVALTRSLGLLGVGFGLMVGFLANFLISWWMSRAVRAEASTFVRPSAVESSS
jgi:O-antigen/teichoic acid export membrane protein